MEGWICIDSARKEGDNLFYWGEFGELNKDRIASEDRQVMTEDGHVMIIRSNTYATGTINPKLTRATLGRQRAVLLKPAEN